MLKESQDGQLELSQPAEGWVCLSASLELLLLLRDDSSLMLAQLKKREGRSRFPHLGGLKKKVDRFYNKRLLSQREEPNVSTVLFLKFFLDSRHITCCCTDWLTLQLLPHLQEDCFVLKVT